jgi:class 3 adenylate cyclase
VGSEDDVTERSLIDDAGDGSTWSEVHRELHLGLLEITQRLGAADLYLVEPDNGNIVYSAAKGSDFATSLDVGPHGGSTLAAAMRTVREAPERGAVTVLDMAPHVPDLGAPMLFMASPVFDGSELVAILILKVPVDPIDEIMTSEASWVEEGFGDTGEAYLVASDGRMRSVSRPFVEAPEMFLTNLAAAGTATEAERNAIAGVGTTVVFLKVADGREVAEAAVSSDGLIEGTNYLVRPVLSAVESLELDGLEWFVVAETEAEEINDPVTDFRRALLIAVAVFVIAITFATVAWARAVFRPVRAISEKLRRIHEGEEPEETDPMKRAPRDFTDLAHSIDEMLAALHRREIELEAASADRLDTVRSLLPPAIAERVEAGDRNVIDQVQQAGIVVLVIGGLGDIVRRRDVAEAREQLDHLVEEIDTLAHHHGLERVKLVGDAYFAGCGLSQPYLDHVPRSAAFALDTRDAIREMSARHDLRPEIAAGIHSGPVTVGLTGSARLVYDLWGETVSTAHFLARMARPGEILATDAVKELLPPDIAVAARDTGPGEAPVWEIAGHLAAKEIQS